MGKSRKIIIGIAAGLTAAAVAAGGVCLWRYYGKGSSVDGLAYVCAVSEVNTASVSAANLQFSGVVEPQETVDIKVDISKTISEISVQEGDHVKEGDPLFTYDVEAMELELQQGEVEIERMQNEITANEKQIEQLESEKKKANADDQLSYTTQIQSLQTDIAKTKYDIKTKEIELEKLSKTIKNATVKSEITGTVQSLKTVENLQSEGGDVLMKVMSDGEFRVKCVASEQNMYMIYVDEPVAVHSRIDDTVWSGTITEIGTEAESDQNNMMYYSSDEMTTASKYPFYITLDSSEGLMLGQHILVSPAQESTVEKEGIWLYSEYIITDESGESYVWAAGSGDKLEKRTVELGESDEMMGDCQIVSGLEDDDLIAFPSDSYKEGMRVTTNEEEAANADNGDVPVEDEMPIDGEVPIDEEIMIDGDMPAEEGGASDGT